MKTQELVHELKHHLPFTAVATIVSILLVFFIEYYFHINVSQSSFDVLHPLHVIVSAIVTGGIFYKYRPKVIPAILVAVTGSILIGSLSDIFLPYLGGNLLGIKTSFHLPLIEIPLVIIAAAFIGGIIGISTRVTKLPHFLHVSLSVLASLFYLLAFSQPLGVFYFLGVFAIVLIAVVIPCCVSDILYPFFFLGEKIKHCNC